MHTTSLTAFRGIAKLLVIGFAAKAVIVAVVYALMSIAPWFATILA